MLRCSWNGCRPWHVLPAKKHRLEFLYGVFIKNEVANSERQLTLAKPHSKIEELNKRNSKNTQTYFRLGVFVCIEVFIKMSFTQVMKRA